MVTRITRALRDEPHVSVYLERVHTHLRTDLHTYTHTYRHTHLQVTYIQYFIAHINILFFCRFLDDQTSKDFVETPGTVGTSGGSDAEIVHVLDQCPVEVWPSSLLKCG